MSASGYDNDEILFANDDDHTYEETVETQHEWRVLIVDDDPEIHSVTKLALNDLVAFDGHLVFSHAHSGSEAIEFMRENDDIAIILLDVVMETEDAGLRVAKYIRNDLNLHDVRIILRTGQPGYAPEESIVKDYDINDYKTKTELTRSKLVTTIVSSLRSYLQIKTINENRFGLEQIVRHGADLLKQQSALGFASAAIKQLTQILKIQGNGLLVANKIVESANEIGGLIVQGGSAEYASLAGQKLIECDNGRAIHQISQAFNSTEHNLAHNETVLYIKGVSQQAAIYIDDGRDNYSETELQLLDVYLANLVVALDNTSLVSKLSNAAYKDWLTGLGNRTEFTKILDSFGRTPEYGEVVAIMDLNNFADINDGLGQDIGNELLISVANRLREHFGKTCKLARISADVFGLIGKEADVNPDNIHEAFVLPFSAGEHQLPLSASTGFCRRNESSHRGLTILKHTYISLNKAKKQGPGKHEYYSSDMEEQTAWRLGMIRQLRSDFAMRKLELWYQPQYSLEQTSKLIGLEALLRWPASNGSYVSPGTFIPLAEHSGLIVDIGAWVIEEACRQLKQLDDMISNNLRISVNVSMPQFRNPDFADSVISTVQRMGVNPKRFELEITESVVMDDPENVINTLKKIKASGISVAIDDFGTGFSSLSYLQRLPLDRIKVDRAFVSDMHNTSGAIIAEMVINLGKRLGLSTIAEGIESKEQEEHLRTLGCEEVQGFLYAKPMPASELQHLVKQTFRY
ncbi:diguanylate phosphodiesterase [Saccharobesus litoralis]|uniref:Diguanylate phosphodiesterase n=1 Tax=Saccharobesus litoralis TaxID=2172099 RepID=A0A2S0VW77_9ALTE|nr:EAL domain-containing protein [Saccharobesus litoralis]AWB68360.1 diguanylate phosphodiesterase [Saccharobesus litoralis]